MFEHVAIDLIDHDGDGFDGPRLIQVRSIPSSINETPVKKEEAGFSPGLFDLLN
ncbi:hypothetical protein [Bifidobacterium mongoliense]|uniref:hypothetical protein n=1 Tax=Bifidobacterium mongoliense TaxID=518643 RepID=UPI002649D728|nr:hypothetical protein [Bifidobacterium mongoliense]